MRLTESKLRRVIRRVILESQNLSEEESKATAAKEFLDKKYQMPPEQMKLYPHSYPDDFKGKQVVIYDASAQAGPIKITQKDAEDNGISLEAIVQVLRDNGSIDQSSTETMQVESKLRRIIRRAILERMGAPADMSYEGTPESYEVPPELKLLRDAFGDQALMPEEVKFLAYKRRLGYPESITVHDAVIHAGHEPVVIDDDIAARAGTDLQAVSDMLQALGAQRMG